MATSGKGSGKGSGSSGSDGRPRKRSAAGGAVVKIWAPAVLVAVAGFVVAAQFIGPAPKTELVVASGPAGGAYHRSAEQLAAALTEEGLTVTLRETAGAMENLALLRAGEVDVAYVQGGTTHERADGSRGGAGDAPAGGAADTADDAPVLEGIGSLYYEPLWVFHRAGLELDILADLRGLRLQIGAPGSGTAVLARTLLEANGVTEVESEFHDMAPGPAVDALLAGDLDALLVVSGPEGDTVQALMARDGDDLHLLEIDRSRSLAQVFRFLRPVVLGEGMIDLAKNVPDREVRLVAPTASLVTTEDLHPALVPLFIEAARTVHAHGGLFEEQDEFPSTVGLDVPASAAAKHYYKAGPSFLYRVLPFRTAALLDRLKIMLLPLLTLLFPLIKVAPPLYRWSIRSKIYRWYKVLNRVELEAQAAGPDDDLGRLAAELDAVEDEILAVKVPPSYGEEAYNLRMHLDLAQQRLAERREAQEE